MSLGVPSPTMTNGRDSWCARCAGAVAGSIISSQCRDPRSQNGGPAASAVVRTRARHWSTVSTPDAAAEPGVPTISAMA